MINPVKQSQVNQIRNYIKENNTVFDKLIIFGESLMSEANDETYLDVAVKTVKDEDAIDDEIYFNLATVIDDITNGRFSLIIMNDPDITDTISNIINKGEVVYG